MIAQATIARGKILDRLSSDYEYNGQPIDQLLKELE